MKIKTVALRCCFLLICLLGMLRPSHANGTDYLAIGESLLSGFTLTIDFVFDFDFFDFSSFNFGLDFLGDIGTEIATVTENSLEVLNEIVLPEVDEFLSDIAVDVSQTFDASNLENLLPEGNVNFFIEHSNCNS